MPKKYQFQKRFGGTFQAHELIDDIMERCRSGQFYSPGNDLLRSQRTKFEIGRDLQKHKEQDTSVKEFKGTDDTTVKTRVSTPP